ncbi:hypothetical protein FOL47_010718 [Perkinsus chesapeaki]|uniref:Protein-S-isoprenylcysteine O-methyltransferase n=1 Tax=Perkinsus chesapeaki TaxID=330153 RepID=A0A7J6L0X5_PERCH|nr:hypothetical protein FOL47_010718 [Perkinsus chesapeaki]
MPKLKSNVHRHHPALPALLAFWLGAPFGAFLASWGLNQQATISPNYVEVSALLIFAVIGLACINPDSRCPLVLGATSATLGIFLGSSVTLAAAHIDIPLQAFVCAVVLFHYGEFVCNCRFQAVENISAGSSFTHRIELRKARDQQLVTTGAYRMCRHPGYSGWFWWAVGMQLVLCNRICVILYTICAWWFFYERLKFEERTLEYFYKEEYVRYRRAVPCRIPLMDFALRRERKKRGAAE